MSEARVQPRTWVAPDIGTDSVPARLPTAGGLADLQAEAYREAFAQGLEEGRAAGREEVRQQVERISGLFYDLARPFEELDAEVERELLTLAMALAMALARQIVRRELRSEPTQIIGIIREAIAALPVTAREVRVHLHPEDAAVVRQHLAPTERERAWTIVEDPVMSRGGCQVTTNASRVDARLETRLGAILSELLGTERGEDGERQT